MHDAKEIRDDDQIHSLVPKSATLAINERAKQLAGNGQDILNLGFGEAGLPVAAPLIGRLAGAAAANDYRSCQGSLGLRDSIAAFYTRRGVATDASQIVVGPGSKAILFGLLSVIPGDVILPAPSWVTYAAQAVLTRKSIGWAAVPDECGGIPDPSRLEATIASMRRIGQRPRILILTCPDNPTGTVARKDLITDVLGIARREDILVIADEIYRDLAYRQDELPDPLAPYPEGTFSTTGLSKNLALGGWRIGCGRVPDSKLGRDVADALSGLASEVWSSLASPMEDVALWAFTAPVELASRIGAARALYENVSTSVYARFAGAGASCRQPEAAFYCYPRFDTCSDAMARHHLATDGELADWLLREHGIATLPGSAFGDAPEHFGLRVATSLLSGSTVDEREQALASRDPSALPWISRSLERIEEALFHLTGKAQ